MSCSNGLLKNGMGSAVVAQSFKKLCQKACYILVWIYCLRKGKIGPMIFVVFITRHTRILISC